MVGSIPTVGTNFILCQTKNLEIMPNKFWKQLMGIRGKEARYYERAKRSRKKMDEFAGSMGITIKDNWINGRYGLLDSSGESIHNDYGVRDCPYNLKEVEQCLEDYKDSMED